MSDENDTPESEDLPQPDSMSIKHVAARLGMSTRWVQQRLADDLRFPPKYQKFQFHHYIGRSKRWTEKQYQALRDAIILVDTAARFGISNTSRRISNRYIGSADAAYQELVEQIAKSKRRRRQPTKK